ncbi:MAG: IS1380 family transposase [Methanosarcinaceae archaeon]|nr:IS1380 family transposase [Methanosarcinaceae archaeon]
MRLRKQDLTRRVNGEISIEFTESGLTSYAGLELLTRYLLRTNLNGLIRRHLGKVSLKGDYSPVSMIRLIAGMLVAGGSRLRHVGFLRGDPVFLRFCNLTRLPSERTLSRWLKNFKAATLEGLCALNADVVARVIRLLELRTITVDVDGTVVSTGMKVERAFRGYNPHQRKVPSYYPITAALAETGHVLRVKNRSGNVHDGKASMTFLRTLFCQIAQTLGRGYRVNLRMDGAFFRKEVLRLLQREGAGYAIKVPFWKWLDLKPIIRENRKWNRVGKGIDCFEHRIERWDMELRVVIYRKKVGHKSGKNYQLDLFDPDDGHWEYSAVTTNLPLCGRRLWHFMCGRGVHEKIIGQLKNDLAFDSVPTNHYGANSAWQQIVTLAHNIIVNFQIETGADRRNRSWKNTVIFKLKSVQTLRFEVLCRAGKVVNPNGKTVLKLSRNDFARKTFLLLADGLKNIA